MIAAEDWAGLLTVTNSLIRVRPRDPFLRLSRGLWASAASGSGQQGEADFVEAARLVPSGRIYDEDRAYFLCCAAWAALGSDSRKSLGYSTAALRFCPADEDGGIRELQAYALARLGEHQQALATMNEVEPLRRGDPEFAYNFACILSLTNRLDLALVWLKHSFALGWCDIAHVRADPDLTNLGRARAKQFTDLTKVRFGWGINWGVLNDDIVLANKSAFAITNVTLTCTFLDRSRHQLIVTVRADRVDPGKSRRWVNAISVPEEPNKKSTATLMCDQSP